MANEIKTRIQLKYDSYANWTTHDPVLLKGEIAIAELAATNAQVQNGPDTEPQHPILFKVGNGTAKFSELPWASALAADVYAWAKASEVKLVGKKLTFVGGKPDGTNLEITFDYVTTAEVNTLLSDYWNKGEADGRYKQLQTAVVDPTTNGEALAFIDTIAQDANGVITATKKNVKLGDYALKTDIKDGQLLMEMGDGLDGTSATFTANDADNVNFKVSHAIPEGATAGTKDGITTDKFGHVTGVDLSAKLNASVFTEYVEDHEDDYTNTQIDTLIQEAKTYADDHDANTEYHVEYDSTNKKIKLVAGADATKMEIDATDFIKDGMIQTVELVQEDGEGNKGQFLKLTWNDDGNDVTYVPVGELVDVYTAATNATEVQVAISNTNVVSATLVNGGVTEEKLADAVKTKLNTDANATYTLEGATSTSGATLTLKGVGTDAIDTDILLEEDGVITIDYNGGDDAIVFAHADKNANAYTATGATQTKTATFGGTVSFNIDTVSVDQKGHATAAQGTVNIALPVLPEDKDTKYELGYTSSTTNSVNITLTSTPTGDDSDIHIQGDGYIEVNNNQTDESIEVQLAKVPASKIYDDKYNKTTNNVATLIFNCGSASEVL